MSIEIAQYIIIFINLGADLIFLSQPKTISDKPGLGD